MRKGLSELLGALIMTIIVLSLAATYTHVIDSANEKLINQIELRERRLKILGASIIIQPYPGSTGTLNLTIISQTTLSPQYIIITDETAGTIKIINTENTTILPGHPFTISIDYNYTCQPIKIMIIDESGVIITRNYSYQDCIKLLEFLTQYYDPVTRSLSRIITYNGQSTSIILLNNPFSMNLSLVTPGFVITNSSMTFDVYLENTYVGRISIGHELRIIEVNGTTAYIGVMIYKDISILYIRLDSNHTITRFLGDINASMNLKAVYNGLSFRPTGGLQDTTLMIPYGTQIEGSIHYKFTRKVVSGSLTYTYIYINNNASITFSTDNVLLLAYASQDKPVGGQIDLKIKIRKITGIDTSTQTIYIGKINGHAIIKTIQIKPFPEDPPSKAYIGLLEKFQKIRLNIEAREGHTLRGVWNLAAQNGITLTTSTPIDLYLALSIPQTLYQNTSYYLETTTSYTSNTYTVEITGISKPQLLPLPWSIPITFIIDNETNSITITTTRKQANINITGTTLTPTVTAFPLDVIYADRIFAIKLDITTLQYPFTILYNGTTIYEKNAQTTIKDLQEKLQSNTVLIYTDEETKAPVIIFING